MRRGAMRPPLSLLIVGFAAALSGCGGSNASSTTAVIPLTYSIGGTIAGLSGTIVLQNNGGDNLSVSQNGAFAFNVELQPSSAYNVTIVTQPTDQICSISNASGNASATVTTVTVACGLSVNATDVWTWITGSNSVNAAGIYGTQGTPAGTNTPSARRLSAAWTDATGNFWMFGGGGAGNVGMLDDLWEFNPTARQWTWQGGSQVVGAAASYGTQGTAGADNTPGGREGVAQWTDSAGNLWLFGGDALAASTWTEFNDLWRYNPATAQWTWIAGPSTAANAGSYGAQGVAAVGNVPPARTNAMCWVDSAGLFWLLGGAQLNPNGTYLAVFNDLWNYNPTSGLWTWVGGSSSPGAVGVYGTQGVAAGTNVPGARLGGSVWLDASGNVWLFGGLTLSQSGLTQQLSDLWKYSPVSGEWTSVGGSSGADAGGIYGAQRAGIAGNGPGARASASSWTDTAGNFWLFGGYGYAQSGYVGELSDLWQYNVGTGVWTWIAGSSSSGTTGVYGAQGVPTLNDAPGAREQAANWKDSSGNFWLFGGLGVDTNGVEADLNDLWIFNQSP